MSPQYNASNAEPQQRPQQFPGATSAPSFLLDFFLQLVFGGGRGGGGFTSTFLHRYKDTRKADLKSTFPSLNNSQVVLKTSISPVIVI